MPEKKKRYAQEILHFYCRPCKEYHEKTHPHFVEMLARKEDRQRKKREKAERKEREEAERRERMRAATTRPGRAR